MLGGAANETTLVARRWFHRRNGAIRRGHLFLTRLSLTAATLADRITCVYWRVQRATAGLLISGSRMFQCRFLRGELVCPKAVCRIRRVAYYGLLFHRSIARIYHLINKNHVALTGG